jgi:hypothetical protein
MIWREVLLLRISLSRSLCHSSVQQSNLAPPVEVVSEPIARPRRLLESPAAVYRVPLLGVVRQSQTVLEAVAADEVTGLILSDHKVIDAVSSITPSVRLIWT